jgi:hypothetical protein
MQMAFQLETLYSSTTAPGCKILPGSSCTWSTHKLCPEVASDTKLKLAAVPKKAMQS